MRNKKLGEILVEYGVVTEPQVQKALQYQREHGMLIGEVLHKLGYIEDEDIVIALSDQSYGKTSFKEYVIALCERLFIHHSGPEI